MDGELKEYVDGVADFESEEARNRMVSIIKAASKDRARGRYFAYGDIHWWSMCAGAAFGAISMAFIIRFVLS